MSEFKQGCGPDCGPDCDCDDGHPSVTLTLDDGTVVECAILTIFPAGEREYIALLPLDENGENEEGEVFLYRFAEVNGEPELNNIEDDDEYDMAAEAFDEILDAEEYEELAEDDE